MITGLKKGGKFLKTRKVKPVALFRMPTLSDLHRVSSRAWSQEGTLHDLQTFERASDSSVAYRSFLKQHGINPARLSDRAAFLTLPPVTKKNYLRAYPWKDLIAQRSLSDEHLVLATTSGSTGKSFYFPRTSGIDEHATLYHRLFLENTGLDPKKSTLVISGFGLGPWIGGIITYEAFSRVSETGFPLTILTTGTNKKAIFEALTEIGENFEQVILCGYPPFIKDVVDEGPAHGVKWSEYDIRILCAAEAFSEDFREYLCRKTGIADRLRGIANIYGTSDLGTMAIETPLSVLVRRLAIKNKALFSLVFRDARRLPTLAQFIPSCVNFDEVDGNLFCTADNALPLVRYDIGDKGGVHTFDEIARMCESQGIDLKQELKNAGIQETVCKIPFVYVYERADLSTKLYGAIIYPEHIKAGLAHPDLENHVTGKFTMLTKHDESQNEFLEIHLELKPGVLHDDGVRKAAIEQIVESLLKHSDEYRYLSGTIKDRIEPKVSLWEHAHPEHFQHGVKQKWVKKS
jgi:phenylacetate-CoA ligase